MNNNVFQTEISGKYIILVLISRLFYFLSSLRRGDQSTVFLQRSGTLLHWFVVVVLPILEDQLNNVINKILNQ